MSNVLTDWRTALESLLHTTFPAAQSAPGDRLGRSVNADLYSVLPGPFVPDGQDINDARPRMIIRYWKAKPKVGASLAHDPYDPAPIEQLILDLAGMLQPKLTTLGVTGLAYFHVDSITPDLSEGGEYGVEVQMTGWMRNPMETGG